MKTITLAFCALLISSVSVAAATDTELFREGNDLYARGDFDGASGVYEKINNKASGVLYNMGNAAHQQGKLGRAVFFWRKAEHLVGLVGRFKIVDNILKTKAGIAGTTVTSWQRISAYVASVVSTFPLLALQFIFLFLWLLLFALWRRLDMRRGIRMSLLTVTLAFGAMVAFQYMRTIRPRGVILEPGTKVFAGPGTDYREIDEFVETAEVTISRSMGDFCRVVKGSRVGWIERQLVGRI
ncbi:hypothetical protein HOD08_00630 [bacterium]|nr:hypothetical protein [bacterium]